VVQAAAADARAALRQTVPGLLARYHVPGLAVTVVQARRVGWTECFGVKRAGEAAPITAETVFEAASLSKPVVAYAALREVERGALTLDKPLARYLDRPYMTDPKGARITARQVLSHTGGLPNWARGKPLAVEGEPGARWRYSGEGYVYLQRVLERVSGQPLADLARRTVLAPLGMAASSFTWRADYEESSAAPHDRAGQPAAKEKPRAANAAASLHCTAPDYARFLAALLDPGAHRDLLPPAAVGAMFVPQVEVDPKLGLSWGLGWGLESWNGSRYFFHWGSNDGFRSFVLGNPATGDGLVVMTNGAAGLDLIEELVRTLEGGLHPLFRFPLLHPQD
jgi:CubicO group peptidase (beta-lactamase class C family)